MGDISYGLQILLLGMGVVLVTLYALSLVMQGFRVAFYRRPSETKVEPRPVIEVEPDFDHEMGDLQVVAAISAALAVYLDKPVSAFNVIRVRRVSESDWVRAGRQELLETISTR